MTAKLARPEGRPKTRPGDPGHIPERRVMDSPQQGQTRLFGRHGPPAVVCLHEVHGFHMGEAGVRTLWSHDAESMAWFTASHPDRARTASTWPNEATARAALLTTMNMGEWLRISFLRISADVGEAPRPDEANADPVPVWSCSIEACSKATGRFSPLPQHRLQPNMIRR